MRYSYKAKVNVPKLVCLQQFCARCEALEDDVVYVRFVKRRHSVCDEPIGDLLINVRVPRHWATKIVAVAYEAKACELHFILNRAILLK